MFLPVIADTPDTQLLNDSCDVFKPLRFKTELLIDSLDPNMEPALDSLCVFLIGGLLEILLDCVNIP